ncbi:sacsin N-terminal ATP-binding-like domain-containing protein [Niallia taxi]|uniref:sacsin N-terminal ATP-binding-like domain-containing protein n=1 Tax=Niallia taxi TaxID=2499688 RepID=UPI003008FE05
MLLKKDIEKIFLENTDYAKPGQAVNQASSLNALSGDLYTDSTRFIYELLQNADDSAEDGAPVRVWIKILGNNLVIAHSGKPFTSRDLHGICNVNNGTKKSDVSKTGYKGIGFKSVFGQSDKVTIYTKGEYFRFDSSFHFNWKWSESQKNWEESNDRSFQFPWQIIPIYTPTFEIEAEINNYLSRIDANVATIVEMNNPTETLQAADKLSMNLNMFLFLKNISEINFDINDSVTIEIIRTCDNRITLKKGNTQISKWLINTVNLNIPKELKLLLQDERNIPEKLLNTDTIEVSLAAKLDAEGITKLSSQEKLLYSYLPTEDTKYPFPVLVNTSFLTSSNRESLHVDSNWNKWIFKMVAIEIFKWIAKLVQTEFKSQAYKLIPDEIHSNALSVEFNQGRNEAINSIPFIVSNDGDLVKVTETIIDFTFLSSKEFIVKNSIRDFVIQNKLKKIDPLLKFAKYNNYFFDFKKLGCTYFEWKDLKSFLYSKQFRETHTISNNIRLIRFFKELYESEKAKEFSLEFLKNIPFIWDHKNNLNYPEKVCFPTAEDENWNNPSTQLSFLHLELQTWLLENSDIRHWLETIGIQEKTDITYIHQTIIPNIDTFISVENALQTIRDLFSLYKKGTLNSDLLKKLDRINLLTQKGTLCPAKECFLPDYYKPRLQIEKILDKDIFVSEIYCSNVLEKDEWKQFFKILGVQEGISPIKITRRVEKSLLINSNFNKEYFESDDQKFTPYITTFKSNAFNNITTLNYILDTGDNLEFAYKFWCDYIENYTPDDLKAPAIAYWGNLGKEGQISGSPVENYIPWFVKNNKCLPTLSDQCESSSNILLNTEEAKSISGPYLNVFNGPDLSSEWRSFFNFRTTIELDDYLTLLNAIHEDVKESGEIRESNLKRVQDIYSALLNQCANWSNEDILKVEQWANSNCLLNNKNLFTECSNLKYFIDGNENIFQDQYNFIKLNAVNKNHPNLEKLLTHFKVTILRQNQFELINNQVEKCLSLTNKLKNILPYFILWIEDNSNEPQIIKLLKGLPDKISELEIYQSAELKITYKSIDFIKSVNVHFNENVLYVTNPWNSNNVLLKLPEVLCRYFELNGHDKKLDYLLRSDEIEIRNYFVQEGINFPDELAEFVQYNETEILNIKSVEDIIHAVEENEISPEYFHLSKSEYSRLKYIKQLIPQAVTRIIKHLEELPEYDCSNHYMMYESIIGGITKNGNEITIVARPSDDNKVLLYYTSEFDVLQYVDAELWYVHGNNIPRQITLGHLLKETKINRIPIRDIIIDDMELESLINHSKSETFEFNPIPYVPQKIASIVSSFANTNGGALIFGLKELSLTTNSIVGLSNDFNIVEITKKAIALLSPIPEISYEWFEKDGKSIFIIKVDKSEENILFNQKKYIRKGPDTFVEEVANNSRPILNNSKFNKTVAIIVAIENYAPRNQIQDVKYATNDAEDFKKLLIETMSVEEDNIYMISNEDALKSTLEYEFKSLFYSLTENDRLIFYYVGHGFHDGVSNYLSTYDLHQYNIAATSVSLQKFLIDPLKASKCKNALIFIDACAQTFQTENTRNQINNFNDEEFIILTNDFPNYSIFLSCHPGQKSYSSDTLENGIWTYHLVKAISGTIDEAIHSNKYLTDRTLNDYLSTAVSTYTEDELGYDQNPKAILDSSHENIIIEF